MVRAIIFDCEIIKAIPSPKESSVTGIDYCKGWGDHANMGISTICVYDYTHDIYRVFCADNFPVFIELVSAADCVIGFNNLGFDNKLVKATLSLDIDIPGQSPNSYDLLSEIWQAAGLPSYFAGSNSGGYGLDAVATANGFVGKSGSGALAPVLWQQGKIGSVVDYCIRDCWLTKKIMDMVIRGENIVDPKNGRALSVRKPW